jgi:hypothetical protein
MIARVSPPAIVVTVLFGAVRLEGASACPTPSDVQARLDSLLPPEAARNSNLHIVRLEGTDVDVTIQMFDSNGTFLGERVLTSKDTCAARAAAVATITAAWELELQAAVPTPRLAISLPPPSKPPWSLEANAGLIASASEAGVSAGLAAFGFSGWGGDIPLGSGVARWRRFALSVGPRFVLLRGPISLDLAAHFLAAAFHLWGVGYHSPAGASGFDPGGDGGLRASMPLGPGIVWISISAAAWPTTDEIRVNGVDEVRQLPRFELFGGLGIGLARP